MSDPSPTDPAEQARLGDLLRGLAPRVLGPLARRSGDFATAEDAVAEAVLTALRRWPDDGVPDDPAAWLWRTATRRLVDQVRSDAARRDREDRLARQDPAQPGPTEQQDDTLDLLFLCARPSLGAGPAVALTLRAVGGLTTAEIARAFLVPEATMSQRIRRAKSRIPTTAAGLGPGTDVAESERAARRERLPSVLRVLYLMFTEGHTATSGPGLVRVDLCAEAIRLTRALRERWPVDEPTTGEVTGLLALLLLTDARRGARTGPDGALVPLADQDRSRWDPTQIAEGISLVSRATSSVSRGGGVGAYQLQAGIAAVHDAAPRAEDTDWAHLVTLYDLLARVAPGPVVTLNRAVALAMVEGPRAGLDALETVSDQLGEHHRWHAVAGQLHAMLGERDRAIEHLETAARRTTSGPEQRYLTARAASVRADARPGSPRESGA